MTNLDEIKDLLWLYSTHERHPFQEDEAHAALKDYGDQVVDGLIWGLQQDDIDLKLTILVILQEHYADATKALPAVRALITDDEDRLIRVTAINTANVMGDASEELISLLTPRLDSVDHLERLFSACLLWRLCRSEDAAVILHRAAAGDKDHPNTLMAREFMDEDAP